MDKIINYLLLVIIFVFDPLAISLVVAANFAFAQLKPNEIAILEQPKPVVEKAKKPKKEYIKLPSNLKSPLKEAIKHARRRGESIPNDDEINKFFN